MSAQPTDFNDLAASRGLRVVQVEPAIQGLADWPVPLISSTETPDIPADMLPGWLGRYVAAKAASTQTPATMSVLFSMSVVAACVQRRYLVAPHGIDSDYTESASLWGLTAAPPGSRKSAVVDGATQPIVAWERSAAKRAQREIAFVKSRRIVAEATIKRLQGQVGKTNDADERERLRAQIEAEQAEMPDEMFAPRIFTGDVTVERLQGMLVEQGGRVSVLSDEGGLFSTLAGTYGGGAGPSLDALLQGYSGGEVRVDRATRTAHISRAAVTLGLMIQPGLMNDAAGSNRFKASGLMARFLYAIPRPFVGGRDVRAFTAMPEDVRKEYAREIDALLGDPAIEGPHTPERKLPMADDAREAWLDFAQEIEDGLAPGGDLAAVDEWAAKLAGNCARIALLFELITSGPGAELVCADSVRQAVALCRLLIPHARAAFRLLAADEVDRNADAVLAWARALGAREGFRQSDVHRALHGRFTKRERLVAALQRLQANGVLRHESRKNAGARASDWWAINPRVFVH